MRNFTTIQYTCYRRPISEEGPVNHVPPHLSSVRDILAMSAPTFPAPNCIDQGYTDSANDMLPTPPSTLSSRSTSPSSPVPELTTECTDTPEAPTQSKKKKKKKSKKVAKAKDQSVAGNTKGANGPGCDEDRPPVLCISRNKHWRYISSYHVRFTSSLYGHDYNEHGVHGTFYRDRGCNSRSNYSSLFYC